MTFDQQLHLFFRQWRWLHLEADRQSRRLIGRHAAPAARRLLELNMRAAQLRREYTQFLERHQITE